METLQGMAGNLWLICYNVTASNNAGQPAWSGKLMTWSMRQLYLLPVLAAFAQAWQRAGHWSSTARASKQTGSSAWPADDSAGRDSAAEQLAGTNDKERQCQMRISQHSTHTLQ